MSKDLTEEELQGKIQVQSDLVPDGDSPIQPVTSNRYVKGANQNFQSLDDLIAFHPNKLEAGQGVSVVDIASSPPRVTNYTLVRDPKDMVDSITLETKVTINNYLFYWALQGESASDFNRVYSYSPDGPNGTIPPYPYLDNPGFESNWVSIYSNALSHKWKRFRDTDTKDGGTGIFTGWSVPLPVGNPISEGDFIENRYARVDIDESVATSQAQLRVTNLTINDSGHYQITLGDIDINDGTDTENLTEGNYFKFINTYTYTFNNLAQAQQLLPPPDRTISGVSNDNGQYSVDSGLNSVIFSDGIPAGVNELHQIISQKNVFGGLKSDWTIRKIKEDANLTRYSIGYIQNPNSVVDTNTSTSTGTQGDTDLIAAGWEGVFIENSVYLATRELTGASPTYTDWLVQKIAGESGEFKDRVFKLFTINKDIDDVKNEAPVGADAISEGWNDTPLEESDTLINYVSETVKFFNGQLKIPWSIPIPYTGQETFTDNIDSDKGFNFKYDGQGIADPSDLTLTAKLTKGIISLWINSANTINYEWKRIYNNGLPDSTIADNDSGKTFYILPSSGTPDTENYIRVGQQLFVKPTGVSGKAVFEVTQTLVMDDATTIIFKEQVEITDLTDGLDAKDLSVTADTQLIIRDTINNVFSPTDVIISAFQNNLPQPVNYFWWLYNGVSWDIITSGVGGYVITPTLSGSRLDIDVEAAGFTTTDQLDEKKYAATNFNGQPGSNDNITTFSDEISITKTSSAGIGSPGENSVAGILDNETYNILLDAGTELPFPGEEHDGATDYGKASTLLTVFDGGTPVVTGAGAGGYLIVLTSDNPSVTFGQVVEGNNVRIFITNGGWTKGERKAKCTAAISYDTGDARGTIVFNKIFSLNSTLDQVGAILAIIEGFEGRTSFTPDDRTTIVLNANLYNDAKTPTLQDPADFYYRWIVAGITPGAFTNALDSKAVTRDDIRSTATVIVQIAEVLVPTIPNELLRTAEIRITDIVDGKTIRLYQTDAEPYTKPLAPTDVIGEAGDGTWIPSSLDAVWAVDGTERPLAEWPNASSPRYRWSEVYQIAGESGDQGGQGGGYYIMYSSYDDGANTKPNFPNGNTSSIDQMIAGSGQSKWLTNVPTTDVVWSTQRIYKGFTATSTTVILDVNGKLIGADGSDAEPIVGTTWGDPTRISGKDGDGASAKRLKYIYQYNNDPNNPPIFNDLRNNASSQIGNTDWIENIQPQTPPAGTILVKWRIEAYMLNYSDGPFDATPDIFWGGGATDKDGEILSTENERWVNPTRLDGEQIQIPELIIPFDNGSSSFEESVTNTNTTVRMLRVYAKITIRFSNTDKMVLKIGPSQNPSSNPIVQETLTPLVDSQYVIDYVLLIQPFETLYIQVDYGRGTGNFNDVYSFISIVS